MGKNKKEDQTFYFRDLSNEELKNSVNNNYPIRISQLELIIDRIHHKYPSLDKSEISLVVRAVFESLRDFLILGYVINFNKFLSDMKLNFFTRVIDGKIGSALRVKLQTPKTLRK